MSTLKPKKPKKPSKNKAPGPKRCQKCGDWLFCTKVSGGYEWFDANPGYLFKKHVCNKEKKDVHHKM